MPRKKRLEAGAETVGEKPLGPATSEDCPSVEIMVPVRMTMAKAWNKGFIPFGWYGGEINDPKTGKQKGSFTVPIGGGISVRFEDNEYAIDGTELVRKICAFVKEHPEQVKAMIGKFPAREA